MKAIFDYHEDRDYQVGGAATPDILKPYLSNAGLAEKGYHDLKIFITHNCRGQVDGAPDLPEFGTPLSKDEISRLRFARSWKTQEPWTVFGDRWGKSFSLYTSIMNTKIKTFFIDVFSDINLFQCAKAVNLFVCLKEISKFAKKYGEFWSIHWKWFVNLEVFGGFLDPVSMNVFEKEIRDWVSGDVAHQSMDSNGFWSENTFLTDLSNGIDDFLDGSPNIERANMNLMTIDQWVQDPVNWARTGTTSTNTTINYLNKHGDWSNSGRTKWRTALTLDTTVVGNILRERDARFLVPKAKVVQKREQAKVRGVISSDDHTYLRMSYVSHWLETALDGHPKSTLFMGSSAVTQMWKTIGLRCKLKYGINVPLDQTHFDWQENINMLTIIFDRIEEFIKSRCSIGVARDDILLVIHSLKRSIVDIRGNVELREKDVIKYIPIEKGILSGWRWTALFDTIFNWGELFAARSLCQRFNIGCNILSAIAQGDDDQVTVQNTSAAIGLVRAYELMNFDINPSKFFIDSRRDEFLRLVADMSGNISGYPARSIISILQRNPVSRDPPAGISRAREQVNSWMKVISRGGDVNRVERLMVRDIANGNGLSKNVVWDLLCTPVSAGGLGYRLSNCNWFTIGIGEVVVKTKIDFNNVRPVIQPIIQYWQGLDVNVDFKTFEKEVISVLDLPDARREVTKMDVSRVECFPPLRFSVSQSSIGNIPLQGFPDPRLRKTFIQSVLTEKIRARDWNWIQNVYLDSSLRSISERIKQRGGNHVWINWVTGNLPLSSPIVGGWSAAYISQLAKTIHSVGLGRLLLRPKFSSRHIQRLSLSAEYIVREWLNRELTFIGM